jgi:prepilin-type N-terminal cleavage/methylation domain-containing protein
VTGRRGFTLFELLVALTLTGIVALLVYGAAGTAIDTEQRLRTRESEGRAERAWRAILEDALRNTRSAEDYQRPTFVVESGAPGTASGSSPPAARRHSRRTPTGRSWSSRSTGASR